MDDSRFTPDWGSAERAAADSQFLVRRSRGGQPRQSAFQRIYRVFLGARAAVGVILVVTLALSGLLGLLPSPVIVTVSIGYAALAVSMWLLPGLLGRAESPQALSRPQSPHWIAAIGVDIVCFMALHVAAPATELQLRGAAGAAGPDGGRVDAAADGACHERRGDACCC